MLAPPKPPPHDDLEALIKEARERQLRRRLLGAAAVAVAAAVGLSLYALTIGGRSAAGGTGPVQADLGPIHACRAAQLSGVTVLQAATMSGVGLVTVTNVGNAACSLPRGIPAVRITWRGRRLQVQQRAQHGRVGSRVHLLRPGAKAGIPLTWANWCGRPQGLARLVFHVRFADGLEVSAPQRLTGHPACLDRSAASILTVGRPFRTS